MNDVQQRARSFVQTLPVAHRIGIAAAAVGLVMAGVVFVGWVTAPTMTVLSSGLDESNLSAVIDQLEADGVPYELGAGGTTVMVPQDRLYTTRARMAATGVSGGVTSEGWEILDQQGIAVSQERQNIDFQRALSGELERTLAAMDGIRAATVHLVIPEDRLFTEQQEPTTASVLVDTARPLDDGEVESVVFLVASAVEGLAPGGITVADATGQVLSAPGDSDGSGSMGKRLSQTRDYERALANDIRGLLMQATGSPASVVVRAQLDFDETSTEITTFDPESQVAAGEQLRDEEWIGEVPAAERGVVGVDGGPIGDGEVDGDGEVVVGEPGTAPTYSSSEQLTDYLVNSTITRTQAAPGAVTGMSVAIVMDDGTETGMTVPADEAVSSLVQAALGLQDARGDQVAITRVPFPAEAEAEAAVSAVDIVEVAPQAAGGLVLIAVAVALLLMARGNRKDGDAAPAALGGPTTTDLTLPSADQMAGLSAADLAELITRARSGDGSQRLLDADREGPKSLGGRTSAFVPPEPPDDTARREVEAMVDRQPEEVASLLRGWLADAR